MDFRYEIRKDDRVAIFHRGKAARVLKGQTALDFLEAVRNADRETEQLAMARATGNFKRGNERPLASDRPPTR